MYIIILFLIASFSSIEITAMKRTADGTNIKASLLQESITPQLEKAEALIKEYGALDQLNDSSKSIISGKLERIFCMPPLLDYAIRQNVIFEKNDGSNLLPILHPLEKLCYPYLQEVPFRHYDDHFYLSNSPNEYSRIFSPFKRKIHEESLGVFIKWIHTPTNENNPTRTLLNKLSNNPKTQYIITPQTGKFHSNLIITRLAHNQPPCAFVIDSCGKDTHPVTYLHKRSSGKVIASAPTSSNIADKKITIIDGSLMPALQNVREGDENCHLYTVNHTIAVRDFLLHQTSAEFKIFEELCTQQRFEEAGTYLHRALMPLLPLYFRKDENGHYVAKSADELMQVHLKARWEEGNKYLRERAAIFYPQHNNQD
jgi:hypothetical protein